MPEQTQLPDCIFCNIASGTSPATIEYKDDYVIGFRDVNPQAPVHIVLIPVYHKSGLSDLDESDDVMLAHLCFGARAVADKFNLKESGYRVVINQGVNAGQVVDHLHMHILGGRELGPIA